MFHDIVVPLDGSSLAECAIGPAGFMASECWARLHLVRVHVRREGDSAAQDAVARAAVAGYLHEQASWLGEVSKFEIASRCWTAPRRWRSPITPTASRPTSSS